MNLKKSEKTYQLLIVLSVIAALCAGLIAYVYNLTKNRVINIKKEAEIKNVKLIMPDTCAKVEQNKSQDTLYYLCKNLENEIVSYAFTISTNSGYNGYINILFAVDLNNKLTGYKILEMTETPGLGDKADQSSFKNQFLGKGLDNFNFNVKKAGGDVDAITAATITSSAVSLALEEGLKLAKQVIEKGDF